MEIKIKEAEVSDTRLVFELTKRAFQHYNIPSYFPTTPALNETKEDVRADIKERKVLIAYLGTIPAGSVRYYSDNGRDYYLSRLGVLKEYQSRNVGCRLVKAVEKRVKAAGGRTITLYSAYRLKKLMKFYQDLGYEIVKLRNDPDYTRAVIRKELETESSNDKEEK
ncbi:MAG: GNAT family N-acetyltransferase [Bacillota bacterium]